jgi:hypothetical protein
MSFGVGGASDIVLLFPYFTEGVGESLGFGHFLFVLKRGIPRTYDSNLRFCVKL